MCAECFSIHSNEAFARPTHHHIMPLRPALSYTPLLLDMTDRLPSMHRTESTSTFSNLSQVSPLEMIDPYRDISLPLSTRNTPEDHDVPDAVHPHEDSDDERLPVHGKKIAEKIARRHQAKALQNSEDLLLYLANYKGRTAQSSGNGRGCGLRYKKEEIMRVVNCFAAHFLNKGLTETLEASRDASEWFEELAAELEPAMHSGDPMTGTLLEGANLNKRTPGCRRCKDEYGVVSPCTECRDKILTAAMERNTKALTRNARKPTGVTKTRRSTGCRL